MIARAILVAALAVGSVLALTPAADAARPRTRVDVIVVGDSLTVMAEPYLLPERPRWVVDGVNGRKVARLRWRLKVNLAEHGVPRALVIALGQNESEGWTFRDYRAAVNSVPNRTDVFMVTTYRDPAVFGAHRAQIQATYSRWMRRLAANQPNVEIIDWRRSVLDGTVVLPDGSHPDVAGAELRARMTLDAVGR